ncbi:hypothetical protein PTI98_000671 [Pleurotus ostreatus]|nr:hypothetical protein PTI98_000671 [Pleurotus ostreatus]
MFMAFPIQSQVLGELTDTKKLQPMRESCMRMLDRLFTHIPVNWRHPSPAQHQRKQLPWKLASVQAVQTGMTASKGSGGVATINWFANPSTSTIDWVLLSKALFGRHILFAKSILLTRLNEQLYQWHQALFPTHRSSLCSWRVQLSTQ